MVVRRLYRSVDEDKDQTYFIYTLSQEVLDRVFFPVGGYTKRQVRSLAVSAGLPAAAKKDSVGLCFLGAVSMKDFLSAYIEPRVGDVCLAVDGRVIGTHTGSWFYTIGQRHGFTVTSPDRGPYVVVRKDVVNNVLFVQKGVIAGAKDFHLISSVFRRVPDEVVYGRYRHRGALCPVSVVSRGDCADVVFHEPQVVAPGQSVGYIRCGWRMLRRRGGGWLKSTV